MGEARVYSERLGAITDAQFAAATERLGIGAFIRAEPTSSGLFGQNVFLTTTQGEFVLRGAPHWVKGPSDTAWRPQDLWQFTKERYFARRLHEETRTPAAWPYLLDESADIFRWPYAIMPRMPGACFEDRTIVEALSAEDRISVAAALGAMLAEMQKLRSPFAGDFDIDAIELCLHPGNDVTNRIAKIRRVLASTSARITEDDRAWVEAAMAEAEPFGADRPNTYLHHDYKLNNLTVLREGGAWRVSGLFDFHEASFGDGALDLVRQACAYLDFDRACTPVFIDAFRSASGDATAPPALMRFYVICDRLGFWDFFARPEQNAEWTQGRTFRAWAERYVEKLLKVI